MTITLLGQLVNYYADCNNIITVLDVFPTGLFDLEQWEAQAFWFLVRPQRTLFDYKV